MTTKQIQKYISDEIWYIQRFIISFVSSYICKCAEFNI